MIGNHRKVLFSAVVTSLVTVGMTAQNVDAQSPRMYQGTPSATNYRFKGPSGKDLRLPDGQKHALRTGAQPSEYAATNMDRPVSLPDIPQFTGKQEFSTGLIYNNAKGGPGYYMTYNTENPQEEVRSWWLNALRMHQWKVEFSDEAHIKAHTKKGGKCTISVAAPMGAKSPKMRASYTILYHPGTEKQ
jgi:hypothetical protein